MSVPLVAAGTSLGLVRDEVVVCIPVYGAHERFVTCLERVLAHTDPTVPVLIADDASPDRRSEAWVHSLGDRLAGRRVWYLNQPRNLGFPANVNTAFAMAAPADVVLLNSDCEVAAGWLDGVLAAARSDARVATVTTLTNHGTLVSVPGPRPGPLPAGWDVDRAAAAVAGASLRLRPRLMTAIGHCVLIRRAALELVGEFDLIFSPGYGEEVDFSQRCLAAGLCHVLADDVFVVHHGSVSFGDQAAPDSQQARHERIVRERYPYYERAVATAETDDRQLARALGVARRAMVPMRVLIDGRKLSGATTGTQVQLLELLELLDGADGVETTVLVGEGLSPEGRAGLARLRRVRRAGRSDLEAAILGTAAHGRMPAQGPTRPRFDLVHRPYQVDNLDDMALLGRLGERLAVTQQDLIGYENPSYFSGFETWEGYRQITRRAMAVADGVLFVSEHGRDETLTAGMLEPGRAFVVHNGVAVSDGLGAEAVAPAAAAGLGADVPVILCIGTDFEHKNRRFALRVLAALRAGGWPGVLLFAGPAASGPGTSRAGERELIASLGLDGAVLDAGTVSDAEKQWCYERCGLVLYPTVYEGFGLVPFEAAAFGRPCLWAPGSSLSEVLDDADAGIVAWDPEATASAALALLSDPVLAAANVAAIRRRGARFSPAARAQALLGAYRAICDAPANPAGAAGLGSPTGPLVLSEDAMHLVSALPADVERPLLALATHRAVAAPVWVLLRWGYRIGFWVGRRLSRG